MVNQQIERLVTANDEQSYERRCASYIDAGRGADTDANLVGVFRSCKRSGHHHTYHKLIFGTFLL